MKAIQYQNFGPSSVMALNEVNRPEIATPDDVLIQVKAASVNPLDIKIRMGYLQQVRPVQLPFTPGLDAAGIVVAVGENVRDFKAGDEVMAVTMAHAYAEFIVAHQRFVSHKPSNLSFEEATSLLVNIGTAESLLFTEGKLAPGQKVFIQGAAGAVGATMVQLAKSKGLYVYATASGAGVEKVKQIGADEVFDYKTTDISALDIQVDLVADCAGGESQAQLFKLVKQGGKLLSVAAMPSPDLAQQYGVEARFISADLTAKHLASGFQLVAEGKITPFVSKVFPLAAAAQAQDFLWAGGVNGKVVLTVG